MKFAQALKSTRERKILPLTYQKSSWIKIPHPAKLASATLTPRGFMAFVPVARNLQGAVNTFPNMEAVLTHCNASLPIVTRFTSRQSRIDVTVHEAAMVRDWLRVNAHALEIAKDYGWRAEEQYGKFLELCKHARTGKSCAEEFKRIDGLARQILTWVGFQYAAQPYALSLEGLIEYADRGAVLVDNVLAWEQAKFAATYQREIPDEKIRFHFITDFSRTYEGQRVLHFKKLLEILAEPVQLAPLEAGQVPMSMSSAFQDFRRQIHVARSLFLTETPDPAFEGLFKKELERALPDLRQLKEILHTHFEGDIPRLYWTLKEHPSHAEALRADNLRRTLSIATLYTLVRMVQNGLISKQCYLAGRAQMQELLSTCNEMDRCNLEIKILGDLKRRQPQEGAYSGDNIPSHYPFFQQLDAELMREEEKTA